MNDLDATVLWTVAADGWTEAILNFCQGQKCKQVLSPVPYRAFITDLTVVDARFFVGEISSGGVSELSYVGIMAGMYNI
ncbi:MAG: hypothetical protein IJO45_02530 [Oscillospiraceae bacterium]|nr:hypothetical protein [Oscillospiraceae bacterium]